MDVIYVPTKRKGFRLIRRVVRDVVQKGAMYYGKIMYGGKECPVSLDTTQPKVLQMWESPTPL